MDKIIWFRWLHCGREEFRFQELYANTALATEKLPIGVLLMEHRKFGHLLINTGCAGTLKKNPIAYARYLLHHKISFAKEEAVIEQMAEEEMDPLCIKKVLLTHTNPECCGALPLLPRYELLGTAQLLCVLKLEQDEEYILKSTMPKSNVPMKAMNVFRGETVLKTYFPFVYDALGDGSVLAVDIRGAANAMTGYYLPEKQLFFAGDAAIDERFLEGDFFPTEKLLAMQYDADDYLSTLATLRRMHREHPEMKMVFSHSKKCPT